MRAAWALFCSAWEFYCYLNACFVFTRFLNDTFNATYFLYCRFQDKIKQKKKQNKKVETVIVCYCTFKHRITLKQKKECYFQDKIRQKV